MPPDAPVIVVAALLGSVLGSFLNVCIYRLPRNLSLVRPGSACPSCETPIAWYDNVPVVGWLFLRGRCRRCQAPISVQYPLIEMAIATIWGGAAWWYGVTWDGTAAAVFLTLLLGIGLTDAKHYIIPDEFTWGGLGIGLVLGLVRGMPELLDALLGAAVGFALLYGIAWAGERVFRKEAMGGGDIKMMAMVGAFVGWQGVLLSIFAGSLLGTIIFVPISLKTKALVPFGVFLAVGAAVSLLAGQPIYEWYAGYLHGP